MPRKSLAARLIVHMEDQAPQEEPMSQDTMTVDAVADIGNATAIVAVVKDGKAVLWRVPTAKADLNLNLPGKLAADDVVIDEGVAVALGWSALRYSETPTAGIGDPGRYGRFTRDFVLAGIALKAKAPNIIVRQLIVTAPADLVDEVRPELITTLRGSHSPIVNGRQVAIRIERVRVEAEAAVALHALSGEGRTLLIDGGGGTTQIALASGNTLINARTRGTGLQRALDVAADRIRAQHGYTLTMLDRLLIEQAMAESRPYHVKAAAGRLEVTAAIRAALERIIVTIIADIKERVPGWRRADQLWLIGGQAYHLRAQYEAAFPGIRVPAQPELANVRGALKLLGAESED
jgi:Ethanolamine utilization protein EutJ (predicted chaperonin)